MPNKNRKIIRLKKYDYSEPGDYFITICTQDRENLFGEIIDEKMILNEVGKVVEKEIIKTQEIRKNIFIEIFCIMPNHIHLLLTILCEEDDRDRRGDSVNRPINKATQRVAPTTSLTLKPNTISSIIGQIKSISSKHAGTNLWQRSFHDHIIRNQPSHDEIYNYIQSNSQTWNQDRNKLK